MGSKSFMRDSYIGGIGNASFIPDNTEYHPNQLVTTEEEPSKQNDVIKRQPVSAAWNQFDGKKAGNQTDEDKIIRLTCSDELKGTNINKTEEYNVGYLGLSILPWEDFVFNPRVFNELFYVESNSRITYDPDDVNTFFHGKNVMPPSVGDISENGQSWNIVVDNIADLKDVRTWLTERCSVFGVTLLYKEKRFRKPERAPCLVMLDPSKGTLGDKLYTAITRAIDSLHNRRRFCVEINLNGCVERWCKRVLMTECDVTGGKLVITNGEEYLAMDETEDKICCVVCFPVWLLQTGIYKLHRTVVYDDFKVTFDADDLFLHGAFQDARCQRRQIFTATQEKPVFRTRSAAQTDVSTLKELGSFKFVSVKKYNKQDADEKFDEDVLSRISEHKTTTFGELVQKRKEKVLTKEKRLADKGKTKSIRLIDTGDNLVSDDKTKSMQVHGDMNSGKVNWSNVRNRELDSQKETENDMDDGSGEENDACLRIPEVASVLCDNDEDSYTAVPDNTGSLFSPGAHHSLVAKEEIVAVKAPFDEGDASSTNNVFHFDNNEEDDSEYESSDESDSTVDGLDNVGKDDLMNEMFKIEQTLPTLQNNSSHKSKDVSELKVGEDEDNERSTKKKRKDKPGVKKALKDLMKTTKAKKNVLPSATDDRYQEVSSKVKQEQLEKAYGKHSSARSNKGNEKHMSNNNNVIESNKDETKISYKNKIKNSESNKAVECLSKPIRKEDQSESSDDVDEVVSFKPDDNGDRTKADGAKDNEPFGEKVNRTSPEGGNDGGTRIQCFTESDDSSSTDGEDVEMIYQSSIDHHVNKKPTMFLQAEDDFGFIERVDNANSLKRFNVHDVEEISMFNARDSANKTDGEKLTHASKSSKHDENNKDINEMFTKSNRPGARTKPRSEKSNKQTIIPSVTKSLDIDMEMTDLDQEVEVSNDTVVKSMDTDLPLKLLSGKGTPKRPKRGTRQYNSNRRYLGAAVPPKQK